MDSSTFRSPLVTPEELHHGLASQSCPRRIIPVAAGQASSLESFAKCHIPGSIFFNMEEIRDAQSPYPQMLPSAEHFSRCVEALGVRPDDIIVIYDVLEVGLYSSPRVAWAFRHFGHRDVHVLNNFPRYVSEGYPVDSGPSSTLDSKPSDYAVQEANSKEVISYEELRDALISDPKHAQFQILDARIPGRFSGKEPELNPALRSGHMPAALNVPLASILGDEKTILSAAELRNVFQTAGVDENLPAVLTCNSGVTAAALDLALQLSGYKMERRLYDGSWMEWTRRADNEGLIVDSPQQERLLRVEVAGETARILRKRSPFLV